MRIEYHRTLLADRVRNAAFNEALRRVIVPGETTVADIGAGTGFLGFLAARLGAKRVDLYEVGDVGEIARRLQRHNRIGNCRIIAAHSTEVAPAEPVDVVISETLGNYPLEENIVATLNDARQRYLRPGGIIIPRAVEQFVCPVVGERLYRELAVWDEIGYELDFAPAKMLTLNNIYVRWLDLPDLLDSGGAAKAWDHISLDRRERTTRTGDVTWSIDRPAVIYGIALWWSAELVPGVSLATGPRDPRTHWEQLYLPALQPIKVSEGDAFRVRIRSKTSYEAGTNVTWRLSVSDAEHRERTHQQLDLDKGFLP